MKKKFKKEFSKIIMVMILITYFFGVIIGGFIVFKDPDQLTAYLPYIGTATTAVIGFYLWKAKNENVIKIAKANKDNPEIVEKVINNEQQ